MCSLSNRAKPPLRPFYPFVVRKITITIKIEDTDCYKNTTIHIFNQYVHNVRTREAYLMFI